MLHLNNSSTARLHKFESTQFVDILDIFRFMSIRVDSVSGLSKSWGLFGPWPRQQCLSKSNASITSGPASATLRPPWTFLTFLLRTKKKQIPIVHQTECSQTAFLQRSHFVISLQGSKEHPRGWHHELQKCNGAITFLKASLHINSQHVATGDPVKQKWYVTSYVYIMFPIFYHVFIYFHQGW